MKKLICLAAALFICAAALCGCESKSVKTDGIITSLDFHSDGEITLSPGESAEIYLRVDCTSPESFDKDEVAVSSDDTDIAVIEYEKSAATVYLYYVISAVAPGETRILARAADGGVESQELTVTVIGGEGEAAEGTSAESGTDTSEESSEAAALTDDGAITDAAPTEGGIRLVSVTSPIAAGNAAKIAVSGTPGTDYSISVVYSSGESKAAGLEKKTAGTDGAVEWSWKIGTNTETGDYSAKITGGGETLTVPFTVTQKQGG